MSTVLTQKDIKQLRSMFGVIRKEVVSKPTDYIDAAVLQLGGAKYIVKNLTDLSNVIVKIREVAWLNYLEDEQVLVQRVISAIFSEDVEARKILESSVRARHLKESESEEELLIQVSEIIGEVNGHLFMYIYELSKSLTQSRRSRAGVSFERVIDHLMRAFNYDYDAQSSVGGKRFEAEGLGKKVDGLVPSLAAYSENRPKCAVITMKTTLRERWQEVVEELQRTQVPHMYLLTLDEAMNSSNLGTMKKHNITVVALKTVSEKHPDKKNLISFEALFAEELPHILKYWKDTTL